MNKDELSYLCKIMAESTDLPVFFYVSNNETRAFFSAPLTVGGQHPLMEQSIKYMAAKSEGTALPALIHSYSIENSLVLKTDELINDSWIGLGPVLFSPITEQLISGLMNDYTFSHSGDTVRAYYEQLPVVSRHKLVQAGKLLYYSLYQKTLETSEVLKNEQVEMLAKTEADLHVASKRKELNFHADPLHEQILLQLVKEGRKEAAMEQILAPPPEGDLGVLARNSYVRSQKNLAISGITLACRAAMKGGLHYELAYSISDLYIQHIEDTYNVNDTNKVLAEAIGEFAGRVRVVKQKKFSRSINQCLTYIYQHLYEELTLEKLAEVANLHPSYLSTTFKLEVGQTLIEYVHQEKIEEAKKLLHLTEHSIPEIAAMLSFHDQSYFTKIFKRSAGMTPSVYRKQQSFSGDDLL
ncbi:helix-turn-helix domain-containing protein [Salsuginibacillus kocurii]|uniref:helix-turn-helix domain-containing protein n=1 Tax=Salsuginibacillus kocurii TaxID=427078 RepID=UPI000369F6CE|nr:helix-turn-helix domain-containing protein [Salsuginibacillus kocurii]